MNRRKGFTLVELLVVMGIIALLIGLLLPALSQARARAMQLRDASQLKGIHQGWLIYANDHDGVLPLPGNMLREPVNIEGTLQYVPGRGIPQPQFNTSPNLFAASISLNLFEVNHCVSPVEPSLNVVVKDTFDFDAFQPTNGWYWPGAQSEMGTAPGTPFLARINNESNVSYFHLVLGGDRVRRQWRNTMDSQYAVLGNRGPAFGNMVTPDSASAYGNPTPASPNYADSLTLEMHNPRNQWTGNICYNDNHVAFHQSFVPEGINTTDADGNSVPDNFFRNQTGTGPHHTSGRDIYLLQYVLFQGAPDADGNFDIFPDQSVGGLWD